MTSKTKSLLFNRTFLKFWSAQAFSLVGSQVTAIAFPLLAIRTLHVSNMELGALTAANFLPFLMFGLPAGAWVDRLPRKQILIACDLGRALLLLTVPVAFYFDVLSFALLFGVAFGVGTLSVLFDVAHYSFLTEIVQPEEVMEANAKLHASASTAELTGPALGGWIIQALTPAFAIGADILSFLLSWILLCGVPGDKVLRSTALLKTSLMEEIRLGITFVMNQPWLRATVISMAIINIFSLYGVTRVILPLYAVNELQLSDSEYGIALAVGNIGALVGAFINNYLVRRFGFGRILILGSMMASLALFLIPWVGQLHTVFGLSLPLILCNFGIAIFNINQISMRQTMTPSHLLGKMNATVRFVVWGTIPFGAMLGGFMTDIVGVQSTFLIAGVGAMLGNLPMLMAGIARFNLKNVVETSPL